MALSRVMRLPLELQFETYYHLDVTDLLAVSHISRYWRAIVLADRRWNTWFDMILDPNTKRTAREILAELQVMDSIPKRTLVYLCLNTQCYYCCNDTAHLFLPLLKRICCECLSPEDHSVTSLSAALTKYDLREKDAKSLIVLQTPNKQVKLVSMLAAKELAIQKFGGQDKLENHLQARKDRSRQAYESRLSEYNAAVTERERLEATGDASKAEAFNLKSKKISKSPPQIPAILKEPYTTHRYQEVSIMHANFLVIQPDNTVVAQSLVFCEICLLISEVRPMDAPHPNLMRPSLLPAHEYEMHYARMADSCQGYTDTDGICAACLNRYAIEFKQDELDG
ncbi:hypothetical protein R3P38DRAFT_2698431 [Favolaschia claudopus]|uniref:F-box domain-containing protein n=1 Tax=Favolaschia claudopus TaxID=2862362 RepID=A0AAW0CB71_9AGAR